MELTEPRSLKVRQHRRPPFAERGRQIGSHLISEYQSEAAAREATLIDGTHHREESLIHRGIPNKNVHRVTPHMSELTLWHRFTRGISVHHALIPPVAELDHDIAAIR